MAIADRKFQTTILVKKEGEVPPKELVETLMKNNPSGVGMAVVNGKTVQCNSLHGKTMPKAEDVIHGLEQLKEHTILLSFHNFPADAVKEDFQPWEVTTNKSVACVVDGEFIEFIQPKSKRSSAYFFLQEIIIPQVGRLHRLCKDDLEAVMKELQDPLVTKEMLAKGKRGIIALLSAAGPIITLSMANDRAHEAEWGFVSNVFDWRPPTQINETSEKINPLIAAFGSREETVETADEDHLGAEDDEQPVVEEDDEQPVVEEDADPPFEVEVQPPSPPPTVKEDTKVMMGLYSLDKVKERVRCPEVIISNEMKKKWYRANFDGGCPNNYEERPWREVSKLGKSSLVLKDLFEKGLAKDLKTMPRVLKDLKDLSKDMLASRPTVGKDNAAERKTADQPVKGADKKKEEKLEVRDDIPVISAASKRQIQDTFLKSSEFRDSFGKIIPDPSNIQKLEKEFGTFQSQLGIATLEELLDWPVDYLAYLGTLDAKALAVLTRTCMNRIVVLQGKSAAKATDLTTAFSRKTA